MLVSKTKTGDQRDEMKKLRDGSRADNLRCCIA